MSANKGPWVVVPRDVIEPGDDSEYVMLAPVPSWSIDMTGEDEALALWRLLTLCPREHGIIVERAALERVTMRGVKVHAASPELLAGGPVVVLVATAPAAHGAATLLRDLA